MTDEADPDNPMTHFRISELSALSGVPVGRIRYYIRRGILPEGMKVNRTTALYTDRHLRQLQRIKERAKGGPLKKEMDEAPRTAGKPGGPQVMRDAIAVSAIPLFSSKGYERVTISDITEAARISRNTFYHYFENKKELFIACLTKLFSEWRRDAPDGATPIPETIQTLALAFYRVYPRWSAMMNIFRASATKDPEEFAPRLEESMNVRVGPIAADFDRGVAKGLFRDVDVRLAAMSLAGQLDYVFYFMSRGAFPDQEPEEVVDQVLDIFFNGVKSQK